MVWLMRAMNAEDERANATLDRMKTQRKLRTSENNTILRFLYKYCTEHRAI